MQSTTRDVPVESERASYRSGFFFGVLSFLAVAGVGVVSTVATSRLYGVRIIGQFALVSVPVAILWVLSSVKEQQALIREIVGLPARHPRVGQLFAVVFTFSGALTATMAILVGVACAFVFAGPLHAPTLIAPAMVCIAGYVIITNTGWNLDSILSAFVAGRQIFWIRLHEVLSFLAIAVALSWVGHSVWCLVIASVGAASTSLVHRSIAVRQFVRARLTWHEYRSGFELLPGLLRFGVRAAPGQIAQGISQQGGIWALGMVAPIAVVGAFSRAQTVPQRLQQASMRITEVLYPTLVRRHTRGDGHGFDRALIDSIRYEVVGMLLIASAIGGAAHSVLDVFGPGFGRATAALALLMLFPMLASVAGTQTQALWATDRPGLTSLVAALRLIVTIGLLVMLTPSLGMIGPALALLAGYVAGIVASGIALHRFLTRPSRATWPLRERLSLVLAYGAGFVAANLGEHALGSIAALPLCLIAGIAAYAVVFVLSGGVNQRDRERLTLVLAAVRSRRRAAAVGPAPASSGTEGSSQPDGRQAAPTKLSA